MKKNCQDYKNSFYSELEAFKDRIKKRAQEKIAEALEEERQVRRQAPF